MTALEQLLESIAPERTIEDVERLADTAVNAFSAGSVRIEAFPEFQETFTMFQERLNQCILRMTNPCPVMDRDFAWGRCVRVLRKAYGVNGEKAAFLMCRSGVEGGLLAVLRKFASTVGEEFMENDIRARVANYWNGLSLAERWAAPEEYLAKWGRLLPADMLEGNAARIRADFPRVLEQHPHMLRRLGRIGRSGFGGRKP